MEFVNVEIIKTNELVITDNFDVIEVQAKEIANKYDNLIFNDTEIKEAKRIIANFNKLKKEINDKKIEIKKQVLIPIDELETKIKYINSILDIPLEKLKTQVQDYVERSKNLKLMSITNEFNELKKDLPIEFNLIFNEKWLNETFSEKSVIEELKNIINKFKEDYQTIKNIDSEFKIQIEDVFVKTLNLSQALNEKTRLDEIKKRNFEKQIEDNKKQEEIAKQLNLDKNKTVNVSTGEVIEKEKEYTFVLKITTTLTKKDKLKDFLVSNFIKYDI